MKYDSKKYYRRSIRLRDYDYSLHSAYFITLCTLNRECLFGEIFSGEMILNEYGKLATEYWKDIPIQYPNTKLDLLLIMLNYIHGIIIITDRAIHKLPQHFSDNNLRNIDYEL